MRGARAPSGAVINGRIIFCRLHRGFPRVTVPTGTVRRVPAKRMTLSLIRPVERPSSFCLRARVERPTGSGRVTSFAKWWCSGRKCVYSGLILQSPNGLKSVPTVIVSLLVLGKSVKAGCLSKRRASWLLTEPPSLENGIRATGSSFDELSTRLWKSARSSATPTTHVVATLVRA